MNQSFLNETIIEAFSYINTDIFSHFDSCISSRWITSSSYTRNWLKSDGDKTYEVSLKESSLFKNVAHNEFQL